MTADEVYGNDSRFRRGLEDRTQAYVVAVKRTHMTSAWPPYGLPNQAQVRDLIATLPVEGGQRLSCGAGAQGERVYDWAYRLVRPALREGWVHAVLARRHPTRTDEVAYYLVSAPADTALAEIVRAAGSRWAIDDTFKLAKGQVGLDHDEVRAWPGWHRHITLSLWALAILAGEAAQAKGGEPASDPALVPLSVPERRRLLVRLAAGHPPADVLHWSRWRRRHQAIAPQWHIKRRHAALGEKRSL